MITISKPTLAQYDDRVRFESHIVDSAQLINEDIWFETDKKNAKYFDVQNSDAFLLLSLIPSVRYNEDITVEGGVSETLLYNIRRYILPLLKLAWGGVKRKY